MKKEVLSHFDNPKDLVLCFKEINLVQYFQELTDDFGKRLNIETKKLIRNNKVYLELN